MAGAGITATARALELLARDLLLRGSGDRMPTVLEYQSRLGIGSGTLQARLRMLEALGAVELEARGHKGTFVVRRDLPQLWQLGRMGPIRGVMPLPEAAEPVALAATLRRQFEAVGISLALLYLRGAEERAQAVRDGIAHFAVLSAVAARWATRDDADGWRILEFGAETYHRSGAMVVIGQERSRDPARPVRVGIDRASHDHVLMTEAEFPPADGFEFVPCPHRSLVARVADGTIDTAVWHKAALPIPLEALRIAERPLARPAAIVAMEETGHAVLAVPAGAMEVASVLGECDLSVVRAVQDEIEKSGLPIY